MQKVCCPAMGHAIKDGYVTWPITYTKDKRLRHLTPVIHSVRIREDEERMPVFKLNLCPWCGANVQIEENDG